jgi:iron complex transport system permease protein
MNARAWRWAVLGLGACALLLAVALYAGLPLAEIFATPPENSKLGLVVLEIRLPRALLALVIGAGLGAAGAALQALLRNPLAEPGVLGISAGAAVGAVLAFYSGLSLAFAPLLPLGGFIGALLVTVVLSVLAARASSTTTLLLAGLALNSLLGAMVALLLSLAPNPYALYELYFWLMGSVTDRSLLHLALAAPPLLLGIALLVREARPMEVLALGEETAISLGLDLPRLRQRVIFATALAVGPGVAVAGAIAFVGMLVPHLVRALMGSARPRILIPLSAIGGGALTLLADLLSRSPLLPVELKLGVITALLGAPVFLLVALRLREGIAR